jgi:hypothetical protein
MMSIERLRDEILSKKPVIHTRFAEQFISQPRDVESAYNHHFHTHVALGDTAGFARRLVERTSDAKTPKAAVVAPWGYGKTSTLIFTWRACEDAHILTVPPFICSSLQDVLNATYGWLRYRLSSTWHGELESVYAQYGRAAFEERVKSYAAQTGVTEADARTVLQQAQSDGSFTPELTASNLMKFLAYASALVGRAGFGGLVVLADELQEFFDKSADMRSSIQKLRDVVWWLAAHGNLSLGLVLCIPAPTEGMIEQDGQDILDRLKEDRLYLSLRNIYSPEFPAQLWDRYASLYQVGSEAERILDRNALVAAGQIATREDLGRGPRSVVDIFQCALRHYDKTGETYTPITLIDDFLTGQISFDMQANPIRFAVDDALSLLKNQITTDAHRNAIKLWAAFPEHGCRDEVLEAYGAKAAAYELSEMHGVHGPLLTYQSVGYTLRKLATFTPGGTAVERIARDFWLNYSEGDPKWAEAAQRAFIDFVLPRVFERRKTAWGSWELTPTTAKGYGGRLNGTYADQYPARILDVQVATSTARIEARRDDARSDFQFDFVLSASRGGDALHDPGRIEYVSGNQRWVRFTLNLANHSLAGATLPQDLRNLKSSLNPNFLTPQLMLAFASFAAGWEKAKPANHILENERGALNTIVESMINYSVQVLFNDGLKATFGQRLDFAGVQIVRETCVLACRTAWPEGTYHPLLTITQRALDDYRNALDKLQLREKRGDVPLRERHKGKLALLFGIDSHKTFEGRAKNDYADLMQYKDLGGDQAQVQLLLHPLEVSLMDEMNTGALSYHVGGRAVPAVEGGRFLEIASASGYRDEEAALILKLLLSRELVGKDDKMGVLYRLPAGPTSAEVEQLLHLVHAQVHALPTGLLTEHEKDSLVRRIEALNDQFSPELDEEALEGVLIDTNRVKDDLAAVCERKRIGIVDQITRYVQEVQARIVALNRATELVDEIPAGLDFRRHLVDLQEELQRERRRLTADLTAVQKTLRDLHDAVSGKLEPSVAPAFYQQFSQATKELERVTERANRLDSQRQGLVAWLKLLRESDLLFRSLSTMPDLRTRLTDEVVREIMRTFAQKRTAALVDDAELFRLQFDEIIRERDSRVAAGNEEFGEVKQSLRQWLSSIGVDRPDFPARYSPVEHDQSYQDMYEQVAKLIEGHLAQLEERAKELDLELRRTRRAHYAKLSEEDRKLLVGLEEVRSRVFADLSTAQKWQQRIDLSRSSDLDECGQLVANIRPTIDSSDQTLRQLRRPVPPQTPAEQKVASLLSGKRDADLTELVLSAGEDLDLDGLMAGLKGLYQGYQISIRVQKRG